MENNELIEYIKNSFELKSQGFYKQAIEQLYKAISIEPDNIEILAQLADLHVLLGDMERARYYMDKVLDKDSNHLQILNLKFDLYVHDKNFSSALEVIDKICQLDNSSENISKKLMILNKMENYEEVLEYCDDVTDYQGLFEVAKAYYNLREDKKAVKYTQRAQELNPDDEEITIFLAKLYFEQKETEKAEVLFNKLAKNRTSAEVMDYLGQLSLDERKYGLAAEFFAKANSLDSKNAKYAYNLASAYFMNGWVDEAGVYFHKAICLDPMNIEYHYSAAYMYYQGNKYTKAINELNTILEMEPAHKMAIVLKAMIDAKLGNVLSAKNALKAVIEKDDKDDFAYYAMALVYKDLLLKDESKEYLKKAIELKPDSLTYLSELLDLETETKNYDAAMVLAEKLVELNDRYVPSYTAMAEVYLAQNNYDKLYLVAQDIIDLDENCPKGYYYNALALFNQGDKNFAIESLKKAIQIDLNNAVLYAKMSEFYQDIGETENAYNWAIEASEIDERNYKYRWLCAKLADYLNKKDDAARYYSQAYRLHSTDEDLNKDYARYLTSVGKEDQAKRILER
ncbi:tetratricopeptide repeat protein [bacterium]|nr:tetratricopeptide repeat protein [bacterium]